MSNHLERVSTTKDPAIPIVVVREHLIRYTFALQDIYDKDILDIACGTGYGMHMMSPWAKTVSGYDYSEEAIEEAKKFTYGCPVCLEVRDLEKVKTLENDKVKKFDLITCFETLEHLKNPKYLLGLIKQHLKPGGVFYFSVPNKIDYKENNKWHKQVFNFYEIGLLMEEFFSLDQLRMWGQDQYGLTGDLTKPYIVGRIKIPKDKK